MFARFASPVTTADIATSNTRTRNAANTLETVFGAVIARAETATAIGAKRR